MSILDKLNESQRLAVEYCDGPELVIAGAGSGKTRVLTYKIAYLLQQADFDLAPWNILALTFTNKAANEMKQRIGEIVGNHVAGRLNMGTFHSVFSRILRCEADRLGYTSNYTIYDEADSRSLISSIVKDMGLDDKLYKAANIRHQISIAKNRLVSADQYANESNEMGIVNHDRILRIQKIYKRYEERCRNSNVMDFDDLLFNTYLLFKSHEDVCDKYASLFKYILVDEYQDTNYAQQCIIYQLAQKNRKLCVVGDDAQSIYAFRGANIDNILDFNKLYPEQKTFKLERNYRSTQTIVEAANSLISHNERQIHKDVYSKNDEGSPLKLCVCISDKLEAMEVCNEIKRLKRAERCGYDSFAVLYRTNAQSRCFEEEMRKEAIPYKIYGGLSFYQRKEVKDVLAYFRLVVNPNDDEALRRIINYPARGIGNTTLQKIAATATDHNVSMWEVVSDTAVHSLNINKGTASKLANFANFISSFIEKVKTLDAYTLGRSIIEASGIDANIKEDKTVEGMVRKENIDGLKNGLHEFVETKHKDGLEEENRLGNFIQEISLLTENIDEDDNEKRVALMTIHAAKGLEFPCVFIVGLEGDVFPSHKVNLFPCTVEEKRRLMEEEHRMIEEERRLMYVAITRAERQCMLTYAKNRFRYGKEEHDLEPSRFIKEIDQRYIRKMDGGDTEGFSTSRTSWRNSYETTPKPAVQKGAIMFSKPTFATTSGSRMTRMRTTPNSATTQVTSYNDGKNSIRIGSVINHQRFGKGEIVSIEGTGENAKATVRFQLAGQKQLLLKFARYEVLTF